MERKRIDQNSKRKPSGAAVMSHELTDALFRALFEEWAEAGYRGVSLERVALRAGAGKAQFIADGHQKLAFAAEALDTLQPALTDTADKGSLEEDLLGYLKMLRRVLKYRLVRRILPDLYAERARGGETALLLERIADLRRQQGYAILQRAVARGELSAQTDYAMGLDIIPSALYWRVAIRGQPMPDRDMARQARAIVAALQTL